MGNEIHTAPFFYGQKLLLVIAGRTQAGDAGAGGFAIGGFYANRVAGAGATGFFLVRLGLVVSWRILFWSS